MRKNILILSHGYGLPFIESCNQYTQFYDSSQYEVTVAYLAGKPDRIIEQKTLAKNILFLNCPKSAIRGLKLAAIYKLYKLCKQKKFSVVICHRYKPTYIMLWVSLFCSIPTLLCVMHAMGTMRSFWRKLLIKLLSKKNIIFAGVSNAVRDDLRKHLVGFSNDRIITLHNTIDYQLFEPELLSRIVARQELKLPEDAFIFGHIGRLAEEKDQRTLIQAFASLLSQQSNLRLVIMGHGEKELALKKLAADLNVSQYLLFTGFISKAFRFMKAFDAFVLCSTQESFGRVLLEAMMARVPVIATRTDGIPEVVGDAGFLVDPANALQLSETMQKISQAPPQTLAQYAERGYQRMLANFSIESVKTIFWQLPYFRK